MAFPSTLMGKIFDQQNPGEIIQTFYEHYRGKSTFPSFRSRQASFVCEAVHIQHNSLVGLLLLLQFPVNGEGELGGRAPLNIACRHGPGREDIIEMLIKFGADVHKEARVTFEGKEIKCPLAFALYHDNVNIMNLLLPHYDPRKTINNRTPLHIACIEGAYHCFKYLLEKNPEHVSARDIDGNTPLHFAIKHGHHFVELLLAGGADATAKLPYLQRTCLHLAVCKDNYAFPGFVKPDLPCTLALLLEAGTNPHIPDTNGDLPLSMLCSQIIAELVRPQRNKVIEYPYPIEKHHEIVIDSYSTLLTALGDVDPKVKSHVIDGIFNQMDIVVSALCFLKESKHFDAVLTSVCECLELSVAILNILFEKDFGSGVGKCGQELADKVTSMLQNLCQVSKANCVLETLEKPLKALVSLMLNQGIYQWNLRSIFIYNVNVSSVVTLAMNAMSHQKYSEIVKHAKESVSTIQLLEDLQPNLAEFVARMSARPRTLKQICRVVVYERLDRRIPGRVECLGLPRSLQIYVKTFED